MDEEIGLETLPVGIILRRPFQDIWMRPAETAKRGLLPAGRHNLGGTMEYIERTKLPLLQSIQEDADE